MEYRHPQQIWQDPNSCIIDFGRIFSIGVFIIGGILQWHAAQWQWSWSAFNAQAHIACPWWLVGGIVLTLATFTPWLVRPLYWLWICLGQCLGWVVNYLLMATVFYFVFTPVGFLYRRWCRVITKRPDKLLPTYWEPKLSRTTRESYYRQF